jgi:dolichol-phosphate mannosyltransferase
MISVVIPVYNEARNISELHRRVTAAAPAWEDDYELILVDDGSYDETPKLLSDLVVSDSRVTVITLSRNFGHQAAISAGIRIATGDAVVIMDGDLQDPPEELPRFLAKWREGYQVVYAIRTKRKEGLWKRTCYAMFYRFLRLISDIDIPLDSGDFCVMDRRVVEVLNQEMPEQIRFVRGLRAFAGFRQIGVPYERHERAAGEAKYTFRKLLALALDGIFDFSIFPLRLAVYFGFIMSATSGVLGVSIVIRRIFGIRLFGHAPGDVPGFASLALAMFFLGGVILIMLGVMGEYIGRIYIEVKRRPFYIVEKVSSANPRHRAASPTESRCES